MDQHSKIGILGFGVEGRAVLAWLMKHGYGEVTVCDQNVDLEAEMPEGVSVRLGEHYLNDLADFEVIFRSPGISLRRPELAAAIVAGAEMTSATNFFMEQCPCPVIGVTGTKGKGTTSTLIFEILKKGGRVEDESIFLGGNIGRCPMEFLDDLRGDSLVVLELSSFQLQDLTRAPRYSVMLNTTIDHLDYHVDREEYMEAKERILSLQHPNAVAVLNRDYDYEKYYRPLVRGELCEVSAVAEVKNGAFVEDEEIFYVRGGKRQRICEVSDIAMVGAHNIENVLPAVVIGRELGVEAADIALVVKVFKNLPYRLEFVREFKGVKFYNDSYSTTTETSMAAVDSFEVPTVLIAGGYDKGLDYRAWAEKILTKESLVCVVLIGALAEKMEGEIVAAEKRLGDKVGSPTKVLRRDSMEQAVLSAFAELDDEGVVVLSPAAASFDMYKNYKERGNDFVAQVRKLK
ncbi:UDP-N-acetylmuramoyl-L-alanine--D-glutamate ligase [Candidatus Gracilibacteria bacterium]|nr:UDP-N-acetylmuramoyl-L-alanine--D-glutamate ligase [Candidatus Gracilibacteria bacterium]